MKKDGFEGVKGDVHIYWLKKFLAKKVDLRGEKSMYLYRLKRFPVKKVVLRGEKSMYIPVEKVFLRKMWT